MIYAANLDRTQELNVTIGLEEWAEDLTFMLICAFMFFIKHLGPYPLH